ncbi:MAG: phosphomannomutase/phosphoglucomutase [Eubacterium sp.]|nr:phosphomannomutase/phosphoglucomutase [Eubacterium sp.]
MGIFKDCDIRGVYGEDLTEREAAAIGTAVAEILHGRSIVVSGDFRTHTPALKKAFTDALLTGGAEVLDIGQASTPQLYFSKRYLHTYASAQITASHNPPKYNGLKLMFGDLPVRPEDIAQIGTRVEQILGGEKEKNPGKAPGIRNAATLEKDINQKAEKKDTTAAYETMLLARLRPVTRKLHIVIDAGNGAMSEIAPRVARKAGVEVTPLFCSYDGAFPNRDPNPAVLSHIAALCDKVKETGADLGIAFDGDGDRAIFVDAAGRPLIAEEAMVIFTQALAKPGDSVVYDLKCSSILKQAILRQGAEPVMERSGHAFIRRNFMQRNSVFAGEVSGHYFFRELEGDDGLYAMMVMLDIMEETGKSLRELLSGVQYTAITPDIRIRASQEEIEAVLQRMEQWAGDPDVHPVYIDGIRLEFPDDSWLLLRRSITEPAFTVRLEAPDEEKLQAMRRKAEERLQVQLDF